MWTFKCTKNVWGCLQTYFHKNFQLGLNQKVNQQIHVDFVLLIS